MVESPVHCPVCGDSRPHTFVHRKNVVAQQNLPQPSAKAARALPRGDLDMRCCSACGFVFNAAFDAQLVDYGPSYDNQQNCSAVFAEHTRRLATDLIEDYGVRESRVVEIGCGKGVFLRLMVEAGGAGNTGLGASGVGINVGEHGRGPDVGDRCGRGDPSSVGDNHLVTRSRPRGCASHQSLTQRR